MYYLSGGEGRRRKERAAHDVRDGSSKSRWQRATWRNNLHASGAQPPNTSMTIGTTVWPSSSAPR